MNQSGTKNVSNAARVGKVSANTSAGKCPSPQVILQKRIGSATFVVTVRFSDETTETMQEKVLRLIESEVDKIA